MAKNKTRIDEDINKDIEETEDVEYDIDVDDEDDDIDENKKAIKKSIKSMKGMSEEDKISFIAEKIYTHPYNDDIRALSQRAVALSSNELPEDITTGLEAYQYLVEDDLDNFAMWELNHVLMTRVEWGIYPYAKQYMNDYQMHLALKDNEKYEKGYNFCLSIINAVKEMVGSKALLMRGIREKIKARMEKPDLKQARKIREELREKQKQLKIQKKLQKEEEKKQRKLKKSKNTPVSEKLRNLLYRLENEGKFDEKVISFLSDSTKLKEAGIQYEILKPVDETKEIKQQIKDEKGKVKYSATPIELNNKRYLITALSFLKTYQNICKWLNDSQIISIPKEDLPVEKKYKHKHGKTSKIINK